MIYGTIIDLLLAVILYVYGPKQEATRWAIFFLFCGCLGSFSFVLVELILPTLQLYKLSNNFIDGFLFQVHIAFFFILYTCFPYGFLMFSIIYSEMSTTRRINKMLAYILALPVIVTFIITPMEPDIQIDFTILLVWTGPYYLGGCYLLISSYWKEKNPVKRKNRLITACFVMPPIMAILILDNITKAVKHNAPGEYGYITIFVGIAFVVFILSAIRYGVLGVNIKFEKQKLDQTVKGIASGTSMLNHAMKNSITNIDMLAERIKETSQSLEHKQLKMDSELILFETKQMLQLVKRIQKQIEDIEIVEGTARITEIVENALQSNQLLLEGKGIAVFRDYAIDGDLLCDKLHLQEVFNNLIRNTVDAMPSQTGIISIKTYEKKKGIFIDFSDNGIGIAKAAADHIFDPFFSTKHTEENFGLGLSYCYLVLQKHGGSIELTSRLDAGTRFTIYLPKFRRL